MTCAEKAVQGAVLVVEDEPILRMMAMDMIEDAGFVAVEATSIEHAIELLEQRPDIRIVFTDLDMPRGLDGMRFAAKIRDRWPPIEIILTAATPPSDLKRLPERAVFFRKPYRKNQVVAEMRRMGV